MTTSVDALVSDALRREIYDRCRGRCECTHSHAGVDAPHHGDRCSAQFTFVSGSGRTAWWEAHYVGPETADATPTADNTQAFCGDCYQLARSS